MCTVSMSTVLYDIVKYEDLARRIIHSMCLVLELPQIFCEFFKVNTFEPLKNIVFDPPKVITFESPKNIGSGSPECSFF